MKEKPEFPRWRYHPVYAPLIVRSSEENARLGEGWFDSYGDLPDPDAPWRLDAPRFVPSAAVPVTVPAEPAHEGVSESPLDNLALEELHAIAKERGIKIHHKAGKEKVLSVLKGSDA